MTTKTFGRRGAAPRIASPLLRSNATAAAVPAVAPDQESCPPAFDGTIPERSLIADIPFLTVGLIVFLMLIFGVEKRVAFDIGNDGSLSVQSLIAFGAVSYDLVVGSGEWWRIGLAPLLHASLSHLLGNCFALFFVGIRLEPMVGRGWFVLIFMVSALGGVAGSLYGNPPDMPSVGASGAITGLIGALFVVSFHHRADPIEQRAMRKTSLWFGIPALLPMVIAGAAGEVDYFAHAGGAIAGAALALTLCAIWSTEGDRPEYARFAALAALTGLGVSILCSGIAATRYATYAADAAQFIPSSLMPPTLKAGAKRAADLLARYPKDPRSHLLQAFALVEANRFLDAEAELRKTMALASPHAGGRLIRNQAQAMLALVLVDQGRRGEAKTLAAASCRAKDQAAIRRLLEKAGLCD
jgi:rhomboid protease GluP